jgi:hypothetical protein
MSLNLSVWKVVCTGVDVPEEGEIPDYSQLQQIHYNAQASNVLLWSLEKDEYDHVDGLEKASEIWETLRLFHKGSRPVHKAKVKMLEGQLDQFIMLDDETPKEMYNRMNLMVNKMRAYGSKRWINKLMVQRLIRAYTIRGTTLVSIIRSDPNDMRMKSEDILARIINHELLLEEARYVKNLSNGIIWTKKDVVALKASKKSKKKQIQVERSSGEEQDEYEGDEEKEYDEEEMALFIKKFNKYISKRRPFKGDKKEKTRSKRVCYNCGKNGYFIAQCPYERKDEDNDKKKKKDKIYKKDKKFTKESCGQAHVGQEWNWSDESSESESDDLTTVAIKGESSSSKWLFPNLSKHMCLMAKEGKKKEKPMVLRLPSMSLVMKILFLVIMIMFLVMTIMLFQVNFAKILMLWSKVLWSK